MHCTVVCTQPFPCRRHGSVIASRANLSGRARTIRHVSVQYPMRFSATRGGSCHDMIVGKTATPPAPAKVWAGRGMESPVHEMIRLLSYLCCVEEVVARCGAYTSSQRGETTQAIEDFLAGRGWSCEPNRDVNLGCRSHHPTTTSLRLGIRRSGPPAGARTPDSPDGVFVMA